MIWSLSLDPKHALYVGTDGDLLRTHRGRWRGRRHLLGRAEDGEPAAVTRLLAHLPKVFRKLRHPNELAYFQIHGTRSAQLLLGLLESYGGAAQSTLHGVGHGFL